MRVGHGSVQLHFMHCQSRRGRNGTVRARRRHARLSIAGRRRKPHAHQISTLYRRREYHTAEEAQLSAHPSQRRALLGENKLKQKRGKSLLAILLYLSKKILQPLTKTPSLYIYIRKCILEKLNCFTFFVFLINFFVDKLIF